MVAERLGRSHRRDRASGFPGRLAVQQLLEFLARLRRSLQVRHEAAELLLVDLKPRLVHQDILRVAPSALEPELPTTPPPDCRGLTNENPTAAPPLSTYCVASPL